MSSIDVSLHFWGVNLVPRMITETLKIAPTRSQQTGDQHKSTSGRVRVAKCGMWELSSMGSVSSSSLRDHLMWLVAQLHNVSVNLSTLENVEEARIDVAINSGGDEATTVEFELDFLTMSKVTIFKLPLHFTIY